MNEENEGKLRDFSLKSAEIAQKFDLEELDEADLLALRDEIDERFPILHFKDLNLEEELLRQFQRGRALQNSLAKNPENTPANQRAQVANSVTSMLAQIIKMQAEVYNIEQFKRMELCLSKALQEAPVAVREAFFKHYEKTAEEMASVPGPSTLS